MRQKITRKIVVQEIRLFNKRYGFNPDAVLLGRILKCSRQTIAYALGTNLGRAPRTFKRDVIPVVERLKEDRISRNISISHLAAAACLSPSTISDIENGHNLPTDKSLLKICAALEYSEDAVRNIAKEVAAERVRRESINED